MSENTTNPTPTTQPEAQGQQPVAPAAKPKRVMKPVDRTVYPTEDEARAKKPDDSRMKLFRVLTTPNVAVWTWCFDQWNGVYNAAKANGYVATAADKPARDAKAVLAGLSDEQLKALGLVRMPAPAEPTQGQPQQPEEPAVPTEEPKGGKKGKK
jgi:hypothetical protein